MKQFKTIQDAMEYLDNKYTLSNVMPIMEGHSLHFKIGFPTNKKLSLKRDNIMTLTINGKVRETVKYQENTKFKDMNEAIDAYLNRLGIMINQALSQKFNRNGITIPINFHYI